MLLTRAPVPGSTPGPTCGAATAVASLGVLCLLAVEQLGGLAGGLSLLAGDVGDVARAADLESLEAEELREWLGRAKVVEPAERDRVADDAVLVDSDRDERAPPR